MIGLYKDSVRDCMGPSHIVTLLLTCNFWTNLDFSLIYSSEIPEVYVHATSMDEEYKELLFTGIERLVSYLPLVAIFCPLSITRHYQCLYNTGQLSVKLSIPRFTWLSSRQHLRRTTFSDQLQYTWIGYTTIRFVDLTSHFRYRYIYHNRKWEATNNIKGEKTH